MTKLEAILKGKPFRRLKNESMGVYQRRWLTFGQNKLLCYEDELPNAQTIPVFSWDDETMNDYEVKQ